MNFCTKHTALIAFLAIAMISSISHARQKEGNPPQEQNTSVQLISSENLSRDLVKSIFDAAYVNISVDEKGDMIIHDTWPIYVDIDSQKRYVSFSVYWQVNENATTEDKLELLNSFSRGILCISSNFAESGKTMTLKYDFWVEGGITYKNLIAAQRIFIKCLNLALNKDVKQVIK